MKKSLVMAIVLLAGLSALGQENSAKKSTAPAANEAHRNLALEKNVFAKADEIKSFLQPVAKTKLDFAIREVRARLISVNYDIDYYAIAQQEVKKKFSKLSGEQYKLLCFYVLAEVARSFAAPVKVVDSDGLTEERALRLQQLMDEKSQAENTLSNILKVYEKTQSDLVANIK
jgi:hypothetical protein